MDAETRRLREVFDQASEIVNAQERQAFVARACDGDDALRHEIETLLEAHDRAGKVFDHLAPAQRPSGAAPAPSVEERIGRYKLLQKIGEGGCGVVYLADQDEPVRRRVALKVIKLGMDTERVIARFEAERQALALMDHPNIARVLDAGATDSGRPYFAMELVRGSKITEFCDQKNLSTRERLELFIRVCQAVQHAHQKGIIHRDLKPSNILVTLQDGVTPVPKIIDFGIAKATTDLRLTDKTLFTQFELLIGTPAYMSPEQAELNAADIDTRSDVYSLGVLLYELLTGRTPFDAETLLKSGLDEMRRTIRETEPTRPSTKLRTLTAADLTGVARRRQVEPAKLLSLLRGDLDWIVLKAMEKDRRRRYETANALATDVQSYLNHEPIVARPRSAIYSFRKLVHRHTALFGALACLTLLILVAAVAGTGLAVRATRAEREERRLRGDADAARKEAISRADESYGRLVRLNALTGNNLIAEGDHFGALLRFTELLAIETGKPDREQIHRRRIAAVLRSSPRLERIWFQEGFVNTAEFSPNGRRVVSAGVNHLACVWDVATGAKALSLAHPAEVKFAVFNPGGTRVISVDEQGQLRLWDAVTGAAIGHAVRTTAKDGQCLGFGPNGRWFAAPVPGGVQRFQADTGEPEGALLTTTNQATRVRWSTNGARIAAFGAANTALIWELREGNWSSISLPIRWPVRFAEFSPDGSRLATVEWMRRLSVWNPAHGTPVWPSFVPGGDLWDCRFSPDGRWLATADWARTTRLFDAGTGRPIGESMRHRAGVAQVGFSPDSRLVATASWDHTARIWEVPSGLPVSPMLVHAGCVRAANFSPDGGQLLTAGQDQAVRLWALTANDGARLKVNFGGLAKRVALDSSGRRILVAGDRLDAWVLDIATGRRLHSLTNSDYIQGAEFSANGRHILTICRDGTTRVWDASLGQMMCRVDHGNPEERRARRISDAVYAAQFAPDGETFVTAGTDGSARIWRTLDGAAVGTPMLHNAAIAHVSHSPNGRWIVTASFDHTARVWDARTGQPKGAALTHSTEVRYATFSADSRRVVVAGWEPSLLPCSAQVWDLETRRPIGAALPHNDGLFYGEFSRDGRRVATCGEDNTAAIWDASTGEGLTPALRHNGIVREARFSPDGTLLLTVSEDATACVWDVATGEAITPPLPHAGQVMSGLWTPDGREVLTASEDGFVRAWDVSPAGESLEQLRRQAECLAAHRLSDRGAVPLTPLELRQRWESIRVRD